MQISRAALHDTHSNPTSDPRNVKNPRLVSSIFPAEFSNNPQTTTVLTEKAEGARNLVSGGPRVCTMVIAGPPNAKRNLVTGLEGPASLERSSTICGHFERLRRSRGATCLDRKWEVRQGALRDYYKCQPVECCTADCHVFGEIYIMVLRHYTNRCCAQ
jgi:hypothetical protein